LSEPFRNGSAIDIYQNSAFRGAYKSALKAVIARKYNPHIITIQQRDSGEISKPRI